MKHWRNIEKFYGGKRNHITNVNFFMIFGNFKKKLNFYGVIMVNDLLHYLIMYILEYNVSFTFHSRKVQNECLMKQRIMYHRWVIFATTVIRNELKLEMILQRNIWPKQTKWNLWASHRVRRNWFIYLAKFERNNISLLG